MGCGNSRTVETPTNAELVTEQLDKNGAAPGLAPSQQVQGDGAVTSSKDEDAVSEKPSSKHSFAKTLKRLASTSSTNDNDDSKNTDALRAFLRVNSNVAEELQQRKAEAGTADTREEARELNKLNLALPTVPVPKMNICIMIVGTRGDIQPFVWLGKELQQHGHRVRFATHVEYEKDIKGHKLEYYPLGGDPRRLSKFMVETGGRLVPNIMNESERKALPEKMGMMRDIINSTWPACTAPDPEDPEKRPFIADAIISNPVTYAHIHCAEALSVPLHIMFPQPWTPTGEFPHPFAGLSYERGWSENNWLSYHLVDYLFWMGMQDYINQLRVTSMGLEPIRRGEHGFALLNDNKVPFVKMWSPSLVPKPKDWGPHVDVTGNFFASAGNGSDYEPPEDLRAFLEAGPPPVFVGFGSMVIEDTQALVDTIIKAAGATNTRVLVQSSWSALESENLPEYICQLGPCPHEWLLPRMAAVIHHGGAGTVAAGLNAGKPTLVCPFFGDQFFWGQMVFQRGVGPTPVPIRKLTPEKLAAAFEDLKSEEMQSRAQAMAQAFEKEDGIREGVKAFYKHLPVEDMVCDVSLFMSEPLIARRWCKDCGLKLSLEADEVAHVMTLDAQMKGHSRKPYRFVNWGVQGPKDLYEGAREGLGNFAHEAVAGFADVVNEPIRGYEKEGMKGAIKGVGQGVFNLVHRPIRGGVILVDKLTAGTVNMARGGEDHKHVHAGPVTRRYAFYDKIRSIESDAYDRVFGEDDQTITAANVHRRRRSTNMKNITSEFRKEVEAALGETIRARLTFNNIAPGAAVVSNELVLEAMSKDPDTKLPKQHMVELIKIMDTSGDGHISFQEFVMFLKALAAADQQYRRTSMETSEARADEVWACEDARMQNIKQLVNFNSVFSGKTSFREPVRDYSDKGQWARASPKSPQSPQPTGLGKVHPPGDARRSPHPGSTIGRSVVVDGNHDVLIDAHQRQEGLGEEGGIGPFHRTLADNVDHVQVGRASIDLSLDGSNPGRLSMSNGNGTAPDSVAEGAGVAGPHSQKVKGTG